MLDILTNIKTGAVIVGLAIASLFGFSQEIEAPVNLSGTFQTPSALALFSTSLATKITSTDTSMTLVSATDKEGTTLASSTYGFIIDEGTASEEFVLADCTGTACTNMTRGVSVITATTSVSSLKFEHRRGASVKITTHPAVVFATNVLKGRQNIENKLRYDSAQTFNNATDLISRDYADALAFGAVPASSETASGFVELATTLEGASSTSSGSAARLVLPASSATSTYNSATAALRVVVTRNSGKIDDYFISTSTLFATSSIYTSSLGLIGKNSLVNTTTGTSSFSVPTNVSTIKVELVGAGAGGGSCSVAGSNSSSGGGGGAGGYSLEFIDVTGTSSIQMFVGSGGAATAAGGWTTFGTNGFYLSASGGSAGASEGVGGVGGVGSGGTFNSSGGGGGSGLAEDTVRNKKSGIGGSSYFGGGAREILSAGNGVDGGAAGNYGGGGSGAACDNSAAGTGGAGAQGIIVITW